VWLLTKTLSHVKTGEATATVTAAPSDPTLNLEVDVDPAIITVGARADVVLRYTGSAQGSASLECDCNGDATPEFGPAPVAPDAATGLVRLHALCLGSVVGTQTVECSTTRDGQMRDDSAQLAVQAAPAAVLAVTPAEVQVSAQVGSAPPDVPLQVCHAGAAGAPPIDWETAGVASLASVDPSSGTVSPGECDAATLSFDPSISCASPGATITPAGIPVGINDSEVQTFATEMLFCDVMQASSHNWTENGGSGAPVLDASGWVTGRWANYPTGTVSVNALREFCHTDLSIPNRDCTPAHYPAGEWTFECVGNGSVKVGWDADGDPTLSCPGTHAVQITSPTDAGVNFEIVTTDNAPDHVRWRFYPSGANPLACDPDVDVFQPETIAAYAPFAHQRTMGSQRTSIEQVADAFDGLDWADRKKTTDRTQVDLDLGLAPEYQIDKANAAGNDLYANLPITVTNDYAAGFCADAAVRLDGKLRITPGNEVWNDGGTFSHQKAYANAQAMASGARARASDRGTCSRPSAPTSWPRFASPPSTPSTGAVTSCGCSRSRTRRARRAGCSSSSGTPTGPAPPTRRSTRGSTR
jgi:hypothetical protein